MIDQSCIWINLPGSGVKFDYDAEPRVILLGVWIEFAKEFTYQLKEAA
jgi:hypothetical protein